MRHFRSILYALVLAPAVWILAGVGFTHDLTARGRDDFAVESVTGLLLLVLAGAAYAILLFAPISPSGPLFGGLVYLGASTWALVSPGGYAGVWPDSVAKDGFDLSRPGYGLAALLALPLICTALSARRWARYEPPVLPLIGQLGRARGRAAVAGGLTPFTDPDSTAPMPIPGTTPGSDDTTTVVAGGSPSPSPLSPTSPSSAPPAPATSTAASSAPASPPAASSAPASSAADSSAPAPSTAAPSALDEPTVVSSGGATADPDATTVLPSSKPPVSGAEVAPAERVASAGAATTSSEQDDTAPMPVVGSDLAAENPSHTSTTSAPTLGAANSTGSTTHAETATATTPGTEAANLATTTSASESGTSVAEPGAEPTSSTAIATGAAGDDVARDHAEDAATSAHGAEEVAEPAPNAAIAADAVAGDEAKSVDVIAVLAAEEPFKIGEVVEVAPEDEVTYAVATVRDERQTTVVVSWDEAATVAALFNGQASTKYVAIATSPVESEDEQPRSTAAENGTVVGVDQAPSAAAVAATLNNALVSESKISAEPHLSRPESGSGSGPVDAAPVAAADKPDAPQHTASAAEHAVIGTTDAEAADDTDTATSTDTTEPTAGEAEQAAEITKAAADNTNTATTTDTTEPTAGETELAAGTTKAAAADSTDTAQRPAGETEQVAAGTAEATATRNTGTAKRPESEEVAAAADFSAPSAERVDGTRAESETAESAGALIADVSADPAGAEEATSPPTDTEDDITPVSDATSGGQAERTVAGHVTADRATAEPAVVEAAATEPAADEPATSEPTTDEPATAQAAAQVGAVADDDDAFEIDDSVEFYVVGRAKPAPNTRAVPPELEETRSLEAPDPDRTRAIKIGELTTKLQISPAAGEEPAAVNEPVRARASVAVPDISVPDLSGAEVTRSLSAPDPDRTRTIKVFTADDRSDPGAPPTDDAEVTQPLNAPDPDRTHAITIVSSDDRLASTDASFDDAEVTRPLSAPDPDRTHTITVVSSDDAGVTHSFGVSAVDDGEVTRLLSAPDPDRTQAIAIVPAAGGAPARGLDEADPERTHLIRIAELAAPMRLLPPEPAEDLAHHPGRAPGHNTAALSHTGDIGGDETQVIELDPDRTQPIRLGTVEPPGERTEIIRIPVRGKAAVPSPVEARPEAVPASIAAAERPDITEDPTSRITPPDGYGPTGEGRDSDPERRGMTVMSMERPPDEPEIPAQRRPD
ncbi:hypothetical protein [Actinoplanes sp. M2I2]|uniref:hypothetical protein n=1 Tax=Actinoplanes sp. M2I2 TaxID=1734444 RepID=UPI0020205620|nr:hypothetical protein [Actinoplanes sp. M2I2]